MTDKLISLLVEFDELGFVPSVPCEDIESVAVRWKDELVEELKKLLDKKGDNFGC